jgi:lipopolysaccharide/colanic/teichoic acid biosynthesis glycosyltransferase
MADSLSGRSAQLFLKRVFDVFIATMLLIALSPLLLAIAVVIRLTSGTPILYEWRVIGQGGRPFIGYKFRTMVVNADQLKNELMRRNEMNGGPAFKIKDDPRITPIGRFLRKYSLDELPQLWSVLHGEMSMVGPRPPLVSEYEHFADWQKRKVSVKPGMTSLWHIRGKPTEWSDWLRLDFEYIDHWSLWLDFKILWQTFIVVITGKNF